MKQAFITKYYPFAKRAEKRTGVPALFALAQSALETGWGKKVPQNMLFGIKAGSGTNYGGWTGLKQLITTTEYSSSPNRRFPHIEAGYPIQLSSGRWKYRIKDYFRAYPTPFHTFVDWAGLLTRNRRYANALNFKSDPYRFADEVAKAGYATDPHYASKVKNIISQIAREVEALGLNKPEKSNLRWIIPVSIAALAGGAALVYAIIQIRKSQPEIIPETMYAYE